MDATLPFLILYACLSVLLFLWDAKHGLLPDRFTCPLLWSGLLFSQVCNPDGLADALWGAIIGYGTFVNATMFDRYLPFSCPLNTFVTDAVR
ncbi:prepilin peptidase, partial [Escherichia coli]